MTDAKELPDTDLAILAIPAVLCPEVVETLAAEKSDAGFHNSFGRIWSKKRRKALYWKSAFLKLLINMERH